MVKTTNEHVAVEPIVFEHEKGQAKQTVKGFVGTDKLSKTLVSSKVLFESKNFSAGQKVFFRAEVYNHPNFRNVLRIDEVDFILVPETMVMAVEV